VAPLLSVACLPVLWTLWMYAMRCVISTEMCLCSTDFLKEKAAMLAYRCLITLLTLCALLSTGAAQTKIPPPAVPTAPAPPGMEGPVRPETVGALEADVQARLRALEQTSLPKDVLDAVRAALEQQLKLLSALQDTFRKRASHVTQLDRLPPQVEEANAKRKALEAQLPPRFPEITEPLRKQLLDNSYRFVLTKLFWLRDAHTISWTVVQDPLAWEVWIFVPSPRERFVIAPRSDRAPVTSTAVRLQRLTQKV
jgi:hypothetical protein